MSPAALWGSHGRATVIALVALPMGLDFLIAGIDRYPDRALAVTAGANLDGRTVAQFQKMLPAKRGVRSAEEALSSKRGVVRPKRGAMPAEEALARRIGAYIYDEISATTAQGAHEPSDHAAQHRRASPLAPAPDALRPRRRCETRGAESQRHPVGDGNRRARVGRDRRRARATASLFPRSPLRATPCYCTGRPSLPRARRTRRARAARTRRPCSEKRLCLQYAAERTAPASSWEICASSR